MKGRKIIKTEFIITYCRRLRFDCIIVTTDFLKKKEKKGKIPK